MRLSSKGKIIVSILAIAMGLALLTGCNSSMDAENASENLPPQVLEEDLDGPNPNLAEKLDDKKEMGDSVTGALLVPAGWEDRTLADYGREIATRRHLIYVVDPESKLEEVQGNGLPMYKSFITLSWYDDDYNTFTESIKRSFAEDKEATIEEDVDFFGQKAMIVRFVNGVTNSKAVQIVFPCQNGEGFVELFSQFDENEEEEAMSRLGTWRSKS